MALTPRSGSSPPPSADNTTDHDLSTTSIDAHADVPYVSDSALNKYAINTESYPELTKTIIGYMKGKRVNVTYYRILNRQGSLNRTNLADLATARHVLGSEYQKIINLEITLPEGFEFQANNAQVNMKLTGKAYMYPNMNPSIGDIFVMGTGDGRYGVCRLSLVTPMSWRADRVWLVDYIVQEFIDSSNHDPIEDAVTITSVFSKENYLAGTAALLSEETYLHLIKIKAVRSNLCRFYHQRFFDREMGSFIGPDGIYDPWIVRFVTGKITLDDIPIRAKNLYGQMDHLYDQTLWARLEDRFNDSWYGVSPGYIHQKYRVSGSVVFSSELINRQVLLPSQYVTDLGYYLFSEHFWSGRQSNMTDEEKRIYLSVTERQAGDLKTLVMDLDTIPAMSPDIQFSRIPLFLHLIDLSLQSKYREVDAPSMNYASTE